MGEIGSPDGAPGFSRRFALFVGRAWIQEPAVMTEIIYKEESYKIIGACFEVYNDKGCGFLEPVYQECLGLEFEYQTIPFGSQAELELKYRDKKLGQKYKVDFVCYGKIIVEIKAVSQIIDKHRAQLLNYLNATGFQLGLLVNFGHHPQLEYERIVLTRN
jgi:GxxExxY protein